MKIVLRLCLLVSVALVGCAGTRPALQRERPTATDRISMETLNGVVWVQTSAEYVGAARGLYALAALRLDEALADSNWTASLEQLAGGSYRYLPPAVVLDVDETVLDNAAYQARLVIDEQPYSGSTWASWVREEKAGAVPGSLEFTRYAKSRGVAVIYLTNRDYDQEEATRANLARLGFPLDPDADTIITQGERPEWAPSDKTPRRQFVAENYRVLLLLGDNYGDFSEASRGSVEERARSVDAYASYWGSKWIVLPNPMYGSFEAAPYGYNYGLSENEKRSLKIEHLEVNR